MSIVSIISFDIIRIIGIIAIIYQSSHQHSKMAYGARDWCYNPKCTRRHDMQLLQQNIANPWWFMHLHFCKRPPETGAEHHTRPPIIRITVIIDIITILRIVVPTSTRVHSRRTWIRCRLQQMLTTGVKP